MRFTLTYDGPLRSGGNTRVKHTLRQHFHPQLKHLWEHVPLDSYKKYITAPTPGSKEDVGATLASVNGVSCATLVHPWLKVYAEFDILMLRPEQPGGIVVSGGDIDNRLKTLFDALRRPAEPQEIPVGWVPTTDQQPLFCLLDDDRLINRVTVETDRLLDPGADPAAVRLVIRVEVKGYSAT
jgi:hypothetical protein